jgi:excisionase family DNA binding protein
VERALPKTGFLRRSKLTREQLIVEATECMRSARPLSKAHLAAWLDVSERYLEKEMERGRLRATKTSDRFVRFRPVDVERWMEQFSTGGAKLATAQ